MYPDTKPLEFRHAGLGLFAMSNDEIILFGGMRVGNSPSHTTRLRFQIHRKTKNEMEVMSSGHVDLFVKDGTDFDLFGLVDIKITNKRQGLGRKVIQSLMVTNQDDLMICDIKSSAVGFWKRLGVVLPNGKTLSRVNGQSGILYYDPC